MQNVEKHIKDILKTRKIHFTLIDQDVIDLTNGIVQGMSGSPIIQNNKLIGCITHASSQNNLQGYGMFIQWMINNS